MGRSRWPMGLVLLFVSLLAWYLFYTERIVRALRADAATLTVIFSEVQSAIADPAPEGADRALFRLQSLILEAGVPMVLTGPADTVLAVENLPFRADIQRPEGQRRAREYARRLDLQQAPVGDPTGTLLHFGDPPELRRLRWIPWLQAAGLLLTFLAGVAVIRFQRRAEGERAWTAMARELAHQLGTPISSLQGWMELLSLPPDQRPAGLEMEQVVPEIQEDVRRLERVSRRFELVGQEPDLGPVALRDVLATLERYLITRMPSLGPGVELEVHLPSDLPPVQASEVLLVWALENVLKNALDALAGRGGTIRVEGYMAPEGDVVLQVSDDGPGVAPAVREAIFEAGVSTKSGGWGVGLTLTRRIVEGVHGGRVRLVEGGGEGATFEIRLPAASPALPSEGYPSPTAVE